MLTNPKNWMLELPWKQIVADTASSLAMSIVFAIPIAVVEYYILGMSFEATIFARLGALVFAGLTGYIFGVLKDNLFKWGETKRVSGHATNIIAMLAVHWLPYAFILLLLVVLNLYETERLLLALLISFAGSLVGGLILGPLIDYVRQRIQ
jgi:archaellum biogenesis protein FlaJ (TadC family)